VIVGVVSLQGSFREHCTALADLGVSPRPVRSHEDLSGIDALILPGGESTTLSMLMSKAGLVEPLRKEIELGMPVLGTCAGMIVLASRIIGGRPDQVSFGALDVTVVRNASGRQVASFEADVEMEGMEGGPFRAVFIRAPAVVETGPEVEVLASLDYDDKIGEKRPVACRQRNVIGCTFHPELTPDRRIHQMLLEAAYRPVGSGHGPGSA
jgi:5'-phosphate synthase pdxT subunit